MISQKVPAPRDADELDDGRNGESWSKIMEQIMEADEDQQAALGAQCEWLVSEEARLLERLCRIEGTDCRELAGGVWQEAKRVMDVLGAHIRASPHAVAIKTFSTINSSQPDVALRYWELGWLVRNLAQKLMSLPSYAEVNSRAAPGSNDKLNRPAVVIHAPRSVLVVIGMLATLYCGAVVIVLEEGRADAHLSAIVDETNAFALLHAPASPPPRELSLPKRCITLSLPPCRLPWTAKMRPVNFQPQPTSDESIACIIYTSGSSGKPKGALLRQCSIANYCCVEQAVGDMRPSDQVVQLQSLSFVSGFMETLRALLAGATLVMGGAEIARSGPDLWGWLETHKITVMKAVPTLCAGMLAGAGPTRLPKVPRQFRLLHLSGERLEQGMVNQLYEAIRASSARTVILVSYGSTEMSANCSARICKPTDEEVSIGRALPSYFVGLVDEETHPSKEVSAVCLPITSDKCGEIVVGGIGVTVGYLCNDKATRDAFIEVAGHGQLYRTGDKGKFGPTGEILFQGRVSGSTQVKIAGYRIELGEVEQAARHLPYVKAAGALVSEQQKLVLMLECKHVVSTSQIREDIKQTGMLPAHGVPSVVHIVEELPTTVSGKLDRRRLQAMLTELEESCETFSVLLSQPPGEPEKTLRSGMAIVLGLAKPSDEYAWARVQDGDADFFDVLGGSSVTAGALVGWLRQQDHQYFLSLSTKLLYLHRSPKQLARVLAQTHKRKAITEGTLPQVPNSTPGEGSNLAARLAFGFFQCACIVLLMFLHAIESMVVFRIGGVGQYVYERLASALPDGASLILASLVLLPIAKKVSFLAFGTAWKLTALSAKWVLIGRYRSGKYPKYGGFHARHWLVTTILKASMEGAKERSLLGPMGGLREAWLHLLGMAKGSDVTIDVDMSELHRFDFVPDLVCLHSGAVVNSSHLVNVNETATHLELVQISVGAHSVLQAGSVIIGPATIGANAELSYNSSLVSSSIPDDEVWVGTPARKSSTRPRPESVLPQVGTSTRIGVIMGSILLDYMLTTIYYGFRDSLSIFLWTINPPNNTTDRIIRYSIIFAIRSVWYPLIESLLSIVVCRCMRLRHDCTKGSTAVRSQFSSLWVRVSIARHAYHSCLHTLNNTQFTAVLLRWCGARVGPGASIARTMGTVPNLVTIGKDVFFGNEVYLGMPTLLPCARFRLQPVEIGDDSLVGNLAVIPPSCNLPARSVVAVSSVPNCNSPADIEQPHKPVCIIGCPAVTLPGGHFNADRPQPSSWDRRRRFLNDCLCVITIPLAESFSFLSALVVLLAFRESLGAPGLVSPGQSTPFTAPGLLVAAACYMLCRILVGVALFELAIMARGGKLHGGEWPFWSSFVDRWHLSIKLTVAANQLLLLTFRSGSPDSFARVFGWLNPFFRCDPSAKISGARLKEVDLTTIGPRSTIGDGATLRTHTFENWSLKMAPVIVGADVHVGPNAHILPGAILEDGCKILPNTIVGNNEIVPAGVTFGGSPGEVMMSHLLDSVRSESFRGSDSFNNVNHSGRWVATSPSMRSAGDTNSGATSPDCGRLSRSESYQGIGV